MSVLYVWTQARRDNDVFILQLKRQTETLADEPGSNAQSTILTTLSESS
jgi:hypothetical protein